MNVKFNEESQNIAWQLDIYTQTYGCYMPTHKYKYVLTLLLISNNRSVLQKAIISLHFQKNPKSYEQGQIRVKWKCKHLQ